ncbi:MAG: histidine kinase [Xanthomonadaceae bacterium]|nr:histidine kinase [Xanthomonadaceae bacterium]
MRAPASPRVRFDASKHLFWMLQLVGWAAYFVLHFSAGMGDGRPFAYIGASLAVTACGFVVTSLLRHGYRHAWRQSTPRMIAIALGWLVVASIVQMRLHIHFTFPYCDECNIDTPFGYLWYFVATFHLLLSWTGLYFGIKFAISLQRQKEVALEARNAAHAAQIRMLRYQLNPHFLFNTLNSISTLVLDGQRETAYRMVSGLAAFLRHSLDADPEHHVTLAEEVEAMARYLDIEQTRFAERLRVHVDVAPEAAKARVPNLILQPLIENAIKHAVSLREDGGRITLTARRTGEWLDLHLRDDGPGFADVDPAKTDTPCVGLPNTLERLRLLYGERCRFDVRNVEPHGADVHVRIPFIDDAA